MPGGPLSINAIGAIHCLLVVQYNSSTDENTLCGKCKRLALAFVLGVVGVISYSKPAAETLEYDAAALLRLPYSKPTSIHFPGWPSSMQRNTRLLVSDDLHHACLYGSSM
jgi:hypothetical protein